MKRLTYKRSLDGFEDVGLRDGITVGDAICRLANYEDTGFEPDHIRELLQAEQDGRLVVIPCKVGDAVWVTRNPWTGKLLKKPLDAYVNGMKMYSHGLYVNLLFDTRKINGTMDYEINHIGKTVFLTREEAEAALAKTGGNQ